MSRSRISGEVLPGWTGRSWIVSRRSGQSSTTERLDIVCRGTSMTAKCGSCYWNVTLPSCAYSYMALYGEDCDEWRPAKEYERGRPRGERGGA